MYQGSSKVSTSGDDSINLNTVSASSLKNFLSHVNMNEKDYWCEPFDELKLHICHSLSSFVYVCGELRIITSCSKECKLWCSSLSI